MATKMTYPILWLTWTDNTQRRLADLLFPLDEIERGRHLAVAAVRSYCVLHTIPIPAYLAHHPLPGLPETPTDEVWKYRKFNAYFHRSMPIELATFETIMQGGKRPTTRKDEFRRLVLMAYSPLVQAQASLAIGGESRGSLPSNVHHSAIRNSDNSVTPLSMAATVSSAFVPETQPQHTSETIKPQTESGWRPNGRTTRLQDII